MSLVEYADFDRGAWSTLRGNTPQTLSDAEVTALGGLIERVSLDEVVQVYLPLSRLLNLHVAAARKLAQVKNDFLGRPVGRSPYVIAIAGSVAVGKSTVARLLQSLLSHWPDRPKVELVTTDGFLFPNQVLIERGRMSRKGFPESYDTKSMVQFLADIKAGRPEAVVPVYSHQFYDIVPGSRQVVSRPDIVIFEGLNVLQVGDPRGAKRRGRGSPAIISDFFDFSIYVDADASHIEEWYVQRFLLLQKTAFQDPTSYFNRYKDLSEDEAICFARRIWTEINLPNLVENILPTRERAHLVLHKGTGHAVHTVRLRQS